MKYVCIVSRVPLLAPMKKGCVRMRQAQPPHGEDDLEISLHTQFVRMVSQLDVLFATWDSNGKSVQGFFGQIEHIEQAAHLSAKVVELVRSGPHVRYVDRASLMTIPIEVVGIEISVPESCTSVGDVYQIRFRIFENYEGWVERTLPLEEFLRPYLFGGSEVPSFWPKGQRNPHPDTSTCAILLRA